jgi:hypothetical protein
MMRVGADLARGGAAAETLIDLRKLGLFKERMKGMAKNHPH